MIGLPPGLDRIIGLSGGALDTLMPMHVWVDVDGRIVQAGPTLSKMAGLGDLTGRNLFSVLEFHRPARAEGFQALLALEGRKLALALKATPDLPLRGTLTSLPGAAGLILDISLGLSFARGIARFGLTLNDFSPCDQTVELLYMHEANRSTMALSKRLSERLEEARADAEARALTDPLTGLRNRRAMDEDLLRSLQDPTQDFAILQLDLDWFKQVNDTFGHAAGDAVLARVGVVLGNHLRRDDTAGRIGGDEFLVILRDCEGYDHLSAVAARLIAELEQPIPFDGQLCRVSASLGGAAVWGYDTRPDIGRLLADTDMALYQAKRGGRGRYVIHGYGLDQGAGRRSSDPRASEG